MKKICICNQKGGVGKTTTAVNLSTYLSSMGRKTLLIDMDPQSATTSGIGIDKSKLDRTIYDVLLGECSIKDVIVKTQVENLDIVPSNMDLAGAEVELSNEVGREFILRDAIADLDGYDYLIVDSPPNLGVLTLNAMIACENLLVPVQAEYYALEGLAQLLRTAELITRRLRIPLKIRFLITMYDKRTRICDDVANQLREYFGDRVFKTVIPRNVRLAEAPSYGKPILLYDPNCKGAIAYKKLAEEVDSVEW
jgi:chromosome partitioning protein